MQKRIHVRFMNMQSEGRADQGIAFAFQESRGGEIGFLDPADSIERNVSDWSKVIKFGITLNGRLQFLLLII